MPELIDEILNGIIEANSTLESLHVIQDGYAHDFTTFHLLVNPADKLDNPFVRTTYPDAWVTHYLLHNYAAVDPVVKQALSECESFGWYELPLHAQHEDMFKAAREYGIGQSGYSFVYEDALSRRGVFSLTSDMPAAEWKRYIEPLRDDFETLLPILHSKAVAEATAGDYTPPQLTPREYECLKFASEGKTYSEIAIILSLSEHTVRSYLKMARIKLDCVSMAQAVAKAVRMRLL